MKNSDKLYDVYVSYPPDVDHERINACLYDNLPEKEAEDLVRALSERPPRIVRRMSARMRSSISTTWGLMLLCVSPWSCR